LADAGSGLGPASDASGMNFGTGTSFMGSGVDPLSWPSGLSPGDAAGC